MLGYISLCAFYLVALAVMLGVLRFSNRPQPFSFHLLFSLLYLCTFLLGLPFSLALKFGFNAELPPLEYQFQAVGFAALGYLIYLYGYQQAGQFGQKFANNATAPRRAVFAKNRLILTACLLLLIGVASLIAFVALNGWLLFHLEKYSQIFSTQVEAVALKRFFYFALVGALMLWLIKPTRRNRWIFLAFGIVFGLASYFATGGTRANLFLAVGFFVLVGIWQKWLKPRWLLAAAVLGVFAMFGLALARYKLNLSGSETLQTFLYLSRDTFSPWQNFTLILAEPIELQGLMPIVREFYVYIPRSLWAERPDIVWNSANYFTKIVLGNQSGLAMSPTLLGSFYIMGGVPLMMAGMAALGVLVRAVDRFFLAGGVLIQAYCLANLFNFVVLVREGFDGFVARWLFFTAVFAACYGAAKWVDKRCSSK